MKGAAVSFAAFILLALGDASAQDLPESSSEVEPPILPGNLVPEKRMANQATPDIAQLERKLVRARQSASEAERLFKIGVLAKVEAENRALRVIRIESELATAKATEVERAASANSQSAKQAAEMAAANLRKAELAVAELNLARRQKLLALGSGGKSMVRRAEEKVAQLKAQGGE